MEKKKNYKYNAEQCKSCNSVERYATHTSECKNKEKLNLIIETGNLLPANIGQCCLINHDNNCNFYEKASLLKRIFNEPLNDKGLWIVRG